MRCFYFALPPILACVAGLGESVVPLMGLWIQGGFLEVRPQPVKGLWENGGFVHILRVVVKPMNPGEFAFRDQFRLGGQPMLHIVPRQRTLVLIIEVCLPGHFVG